MQRISSSRIIGLGWLLAMLLIEVAARPDESEVDDPLGRAAQVVAMVRQLVERSPKDEISVSQLARSVGLSPRHFRRLFHRAAGMTPSEYLWAYRTAYGKSLLLAGSHNVTQAALAAGFADQTHMSRHFRALYGVAPGTFLPRSPF